MYESHFGLREPPFGITPDTSFAYACNSHQEALNTLLVAARNGEGFMKVTGEVGTGKTLLCRRFLATLDGRFVSAYVPNPYLEPRTLMFALADELGITLPRDADQHQLLKELARALLNFARQGKTVVVCLDEAQAMPQETLEALRLLTNLETEKRKLLQVVLFGQPELDRRLREPGLRQLRQRITFSYTLAPLDHDGMINYVRHRLQVAGWRGAALFSADALQRIFRASNGTPRLVNVLCHKALMAAYGGGVDRVDAQHARLAVADTEGARQPRFAWWPLAVGAPLAAVMVLSGWLAQSSWSHWLS